MASGGNSLVPSFVIKEGLINPCLTRGADFEAYTGPMQADPNADEGRYIVNMIGSSTVQDLQGDIMLMSALDDMTKVPDNLTILLNHDMTVPDSIFGGLVGRPWIKSSGGIADLHLSAEVETSNPKAMQTYAMIARGRRLGCSIGCMVLDYDYDKHGDTLLIKSVLPVEYSVCSVPANQRCWVEIATKSLFERSLVEGRADDALRLAPAVRGMFWRSYEALVKHVENTALRNDLERVRPRDTAPQRIMCAFTEGQSGFALSDTKGITKSLSRDEVSQLLEKSMQQKTPAQPSPEIITAPEDIDTTKDVGGKTSWDLMDIKTEWDGSKAEQQIFAWAKDEDGKIVASKAKQCFLYYDPDNADKQSGYKMPFCFVASGTPKIVPLGVRSAAGVLSGSMGGVSASGADKDGMKSKIKTIYGRINSQFSPDPKWEVPWEKEDSEKSATDIVAKEVLDSAPLNRQEMEESNVNEKDREKSFPKAADVEISAEGKHASCIGKHSHPHTATGDQGGDETHDHMHEHNGDADHGHIHEDKAEKSTPTPDVVVEIATQESVIASVNATTSTNASAETTEIVIEKSTPVPDVVAESEGFVPIPVQDEQKLALLSIYNSFGAQLGFPPRTFGEEVQVQKSMMPLSDQYTPQEIITMLSAADSSIDCLMQAFGVPDIDAGPVVDSDDSDDSAVSEYQDYPMRYSFDASIMKSALDILTKEGRELSIKNKSLITAMHDYAIATHDICSQMHPDSCKCASVQTETEEEAEDEARMQGEGQPIQQYPGMSASIEAITGLTKALGAINVKEVARNAVDEALTEARKSLDLLQREQRIMLENMRKLKEMPLGRPTQFVGRTTTVTEDTATYQDMLTAGVSTLTDEDLEVVDVPTLAGTIQCKRWPAGFKVGERPRLTEYQKTFMNPLHYIAYENGSADVLVPIAATEGVAAR